MVYLMEEADIVTSGFKRCVELGLIKHTVETIVLEYPEIFSEKTRACAEFRLRIARNPKLLKAAS